MERTFRIALASVAMVAGLAIAGSKPAKAQVSVSVPLPHGRLVIGHPAFHSGAYVPYGYRVYSRPGYGYGFLYRSNWIPVRRYTNRWVVVDSPAYAYGYTPDYAYDGYDGYDDGYYAPGYAYAPGYVGYYGPYYGYPYAYSYGRRYYYGHGYSHGGGYNHGGSYGHSRGGGSHGGGSHGGGNRGGGNHGGGNHGGGSHRNH